MLTAGVSCMLGGAAASFMTAPLQQSASQQSARSAVATMAESVVKLGTRGSPLALAQAYETKQRMQARLSVRKVSLLCHHSAPLLLARLLITWACADCGLCACVQIDSRLAGI